MTEQEVFNIVIKALIQHFPHCMRIFSLACYDISCQRKECWSCCFHRPQITDWEISRIIPELEDVFLKKYTSERTDLYTVVKFFAAA